MDLDILSTTIDSPEHWYEIRAALSQLAKNNVEYRRDFAVVIRAIDTKIREASQIAVGFKLKPGNVHIQQRYDEKLREANDILYPIQQNLLLVLLSKQH
jgi:hypothetical protein